MKSLCIAVSVAGLLLGASTASEATTFAKPGAYTLLATVKTVGYSQCPYTVAAQSLAGYTAFAGFKTSGSTVTLKKNWVIAISPTSSADQKYAYTLGEAKSASGQTLTFNGTVTYGNAADQFTAKTGTYNLTVNATTLASTLKVKGPNCEITYSITFTRGIPTKFLNLL